MDNNYSNNSRFVIHSRKSGKLDNVVASIVLRNTDDQIEKEAKKTSEKERKQKNERKEREGERWKKNELE